MKIHFTLVGLMAAALSFLACSQDEMTGGQKETMLTQVSAIMPRYEMEEATRLKYDDDWNPYWSRGDKFGLHFKTSKGYGGTWMTLDTVDADDPTIGSFTGNGIQLQSGSTYYAFFPFNTDITIPVVTLDYREQNQPYNNSVNHITDFNFMYGTLDTDANGKGKVELKQAGCLFTMLLRGLDANAIYTKVEIETEYRSFYPVVELNCKLPFLGKVTLASLSFCFFVFVLLLQFAGFLS